MSEKGCCRPKSGDLLLPLSPRHIVLIYLVQLHQPSVLGKGKSVVRGALLSAGVLRAAWKSAMKNINMLAILRSNTEPRWACSQESVVLLRYYLWQSINASLYIHTSKITPLYLQVVLRALSQVMRTGTTRWWQAQISFLRYSYGVVWFLSNTMRAEFLCLVLNCFRMCNHRENG